jgi:glycerate 2-kinase
MSVLLFSAEYSSLFAVKGSRDLLARLYRAALDGTDPEAAVRQALALPEVARALSAARAVGIFAAGKAAAGMARGASSVGAARTLTVLPKGHPARGLDRRDVAFAAHPEPDASSVRAARRALRFFASFSRGDVVLCLVSGGASSLVALPRQGMTLAEKRRRIRALARSGASILALNRLRTSLSSIKGGRLGRATRARLVTLVLSDVPGDRAASVGSGPTVRGRRDDLVKLVASNSAGLDTAAREARRLGWRVVRVRRRLSGGARAEGARLARAATKLPPGSVLIAGGETVVALGSRPGRGGRCLELALAAAQPLGGKRDVALLAAGSDGLDGNSGAAGARVDGRTLERARRAGRDPETDLRRHDTRALFGATGGLFVTGPTGTNVGDWVFAARGPGPGRRRPI